MKVIILTIKTPGNIFLVNQIMQNFSVVGCVKLIPPPKKKSDVYRLWIKRIKKHGFLKALNKYLLLKLQDKLWNDEQASKQYFFPDKDNIDYLINTDELITHNINSDEVAEFIIQRAPDVIAVCGSNIIKPKIFKLAPKGTINIHCGIAPDYRSANPVEWAIYNKDFNKIGVTIHYIDEKLDTGDIIYQKTVNLSPNDTVTSLYCKNIRNGADLMLNALKAIENGTITATSQNAGSGRHYNSIEFGLIQKLKVINNLKQYWD